MNSQTIIEEKKNILAYLSKRQIHDAFNTLVNLANNLPEWQLGAKIGELETNYKFMLHYYFEGVEDVERSNVYNNIIRSIYELTDDVSDELLKQESSNLFYERLRAYGYRANQPKINDYTNHLKEVMSSISLLDLLESGEEKRSRNRELAVQRERIATELFNSIFISPRAFVEDLNNYIAFVDGHDIPLREKCLFVSALTLSLFHRFDSKKVQLLIHLSTSSELELRARAHVGLVLLMQMYDARWDFYPDLQVLIEPLTNDVNFRASIQRIIIQLIRARETEKISKRVTEEIIPEMMRFNNLAGKKLNIEDYISGDADFAEKNPEWAKELKESGLADKLQEYSNLQMEGADVFLSTFSRLKSFPFFSDMSNWFLPFDSSYSTLQPLFPEDVKNSLIQSVIISSNHMCDSDKYSFCLSMLQMPTAQREMMIGQMGAESEQWKQLQQEAKNMNAGAEEEIISNQYIQDLYRFFKLFPYRNNFFDIFRMKLNFYDKKSIAPLISNTDSMQKIGLYCFDKNNFNEAMDIFRRLVSTGHETSDLWSKIGYCKQMLGDVDGALNAYLQADSIMPNNTWTIKRIAQLYKSKKDPESAIEYYKKAALLTPDNINLELNIGHCHLELRDYEKALNCYFKVEVLDTKSKKALRPIAWTAFLMHRFDLSKKYYDQILSDQPTMHDYLNAGHVELVMGNMHKALSHYKQSAVRELNIEAFRKLFEADKEILKECNIDDQLFLFLLDQVQYELD